MGLAPKKANGGGLFISLEGGDGSGKTTLAQLLKTKLLAAGVEVLNTREPGGTPLGEKIRELIVQEGLGRTVLAELFLMEAARTEHVQTVIMPALALGKVVISDRFTDSSIAYQGYGLGLDQKLIQQCNEMACMGVAPDLTVLIELSEAAAEERMKNRTEKKSYYDLASADFHRRVNRGYRAIAQQFPDRILCLSGTHSPEKLSELVLESSQLKRFFGNKNK